MNDHSCEALIITCVDFRFQEYINNWIKDNFAPRSYDRVAYAGGVFDFETIIKQIEISKRLHHINKVILINHEDCGAYGEAGTDQRHHHDLIEAKKEIESEMEGLKVETYYLHLDGTFEKI